MVTFFPRRFIIVGVLIFAGDTFDVITSRSALMLLFTASLVRRTPFEIIIVIIVPHGRFSTVRDEDRHGGKHGGGRRLDRLRKVGALLG